MSIFAVTKLTKLISKEERVIGRLQMRRQHYLAVSCFFFPQEIGEEGRKESEYFTKET